MVRTYATECVEERSLYIYKVYLALVLFSSKYFNVLQMITLFLLRFQAQSKLFCETVRAEHKQRRTKTDVHVEYNHYCSMKLKAAEKMQGQ